VSTTRILVSTAVLTAALWTPARAQDACGLLEKQAAQLMGTAAGRTERLASGTTTDICAIWSADRAASVKVIVERGSNPAQSLAMSKMIATRSRDPEITVREEPTLGANAFSIREEGQITFRFGDTGRVLNLSLGKDRGVADADVERVRRFAKQLVGVH
jgi:hypothetical protein